LSFDICHYKPGVNSYHFQSLTRLFRIAKDHCRGGGPAGKGESRKKAGVRISQTAGLIDTEIPSLVKSCESLSSSGTDGYRFHQTASSESPFNKL